MTDAQQIDHAVRAKAVLDNSAYQDAHNAIRTRLLNALLALKMEEAEQAEEFRRCIKLLDSIKAELDAAVSRGKYSEMKAASIETARKNPLRNFFR